MSRRRASFFVFLVLTSAVATTPARGAPAACKPFVPKVAMVDGNGNLRTDSLKAPVIKVGDSATKSHPVVRRFTYGPVLSRLIFYLGPEIMDGHKYLNFQVTTSKPARGLHIRIDWLPTSVTTEIDIDLYDAKGRKVGVSDATNALPTDVEHALFDPIFGPRTINGGPGYESILGVSARRCAGFTLDSHALWTLGEEVRLTAWLGEIRPQI